MKISLNRGGVDMVRLLALITFPVMALAQPPLVPLLWTQGQSPETIRQVVGEGGAGDEAKALKGEVWIFDEWMSPSGGAGGKVVAQHPEFALHTVEERTLVVQGPAAERDWEIPTPVAANEQVVSVVAFAEPTRPGQDTVILPGGTRVRWAAPDGRWRICWSLARSHAPRPGWRMTNMIDVMNPLATAEFIRITHEATYAQFHEDFGKTIKGFFSDEAGFRNVDSYDSLPGKPGASMPWSPAFAAYRS